MVDALIPWFLMGCTMVTMKLAGDKNPLAWKIGIASQAVWLYFDYTVEAWGLMPLAVILTAIYVRNLRRWQREAA